MGDSKTLLTSRTFWGAVIMMISSFLGFFDITLGEDEQNKLALMLADLAGFGLVLWGRIAAKKAITTKSPTITGLLLITCLCLPGCALKGLQPHEQAMAVTNEAITMYETLHGEYLRLHAAFPEQREMMETTVAPVMDTARVALVTLGDATAVWVRTKEKPSDWDGLKTRALQLLTDAGKILTRIKGS